MIELNRFGTIDPSSIGYDLGSVRSDDCLGGDAEVPDPEGRLRADPVAAEYVRLCHGLDEGGDDFVWPLHWRNIPVKILSRVFSFEEAVRLHFFSPITCELDGWLKENHFLLWKVENVLWQYGYCSRYNRLGHVLRCLSRVAIPGMEVGLGHSSHFNEYGPCVQDRKVYLDGAMGLFMYHRGTHVLTAGFSPGGDGVFVAQVQLRRKKGNRFLYGLKEHYLDLVLESLFGAFGDDLWLVRGDSAVDAIKRSYGKMECSMTAEDEARIRSLYDRSLARFVRTGDELVRHGRAFVRLARV